MNALPFVRPDLDVRASDATNDNPLFFFVPLVWPFFYGEQVLAHGVRIEQSAQLGVRNRIQLTIAEQMFPGNKDFQSRCLFSELCRQRFDKLIKQSPWLITWYRIGFQEFVMQTTIQSMCHHGKCHLCETCTAA